jgi:voltage-gated potassium channel
MSELGRALVILSGVLIYGTLGFAFFENIPLFTALFWTVMTISTVGYYGDVAPLTTGGFAIAATSVIGGLGALLYILQNLFVKPTIEMKIKEVLGMGADIKKGLKNHIIVCGYGDIGESVVEQLEAIKEKFIIVEKNPERVKPIEERNFSYFRGVIQGDASQEDVLKKLNIESAKNLILTSKDDANNVFITLTAYGRMLSDFFKTP